MNEKKKKKEKNKFSRNELAQSREKVADEGDYIAPPSSDNTLSFHGDVLPYTISFKRM